MGFLNTRSFFHARLKGRTGLQAVLSNTGWLFLDKIVRMAVGLFVGVWVARYLGPAQFGLFSYAAAFVTLFSVLATLGLNDIVVRDIVRRPAQRDKILGSAFFLKLAGSLLALVFSLACVAFLRRGELLTFYLVGISAAGFVFQAFDVIDFYFQSQVQSKYPVYAKNTAFLLVSAAKVFLILHHAPLIAFAWAGLAEIIIGGAAMVGLYHIRGRSITAWKTNFATSAELLKNSLPLTLSALFITLYMRLDQVMLGQMVNDTAVGNYSAAVRLSEMWYFVPMSFTSSVFPMVIKARSSGADVYLGRLQKLYDLMAVLSIAIAIPITFLSGAMIQLFYGSQYVGAGGILAVHIWSSVFIFLGVASSQYLITENLISITFYRTAAGLAANIILNLMLIPRYGGIGAAFATLISQAVAAYLSNALFRQSRIVFVMQSRSLNLFRAIGNIRVS